MNGLLQLGRLKELVEAGEIDTVVVAFPDMQGRLMGKRVPGRSYFLASAWSRRPTAATTCSTTDMEMEPVPGYEAASWELGYGDFVHQAGSGDPAPVPWLEGTALVLCDLLDHHSHAEHAPLAPRTMLKRQVARLEADAGWTANMAASELEFYVFDRGLRRAAREQGLQGPQARRLVHRGLPHLPDHQGRRP